VEGSTVIAVGITLALSFPTLPASAQQLPVSLQQQGQTIEVAIGNGNPGDQGIHQLDIARWGRAGLTQGYQTLTLERRTIRESFRNYCRAYQYYWNRVWAGIKQAPQSIALTATPKPCGGDRSASPLHA